MPFTFTDIAINVLFLLDAVESFSFDLDTLSPKPPSLRTFMGIMLFLFASGIQHDCHAYLTSLEKYTLPSHPLFQRVICPHYTAECAIYLSLSIVAAPQGYLVNRTIFGALFFVVIN